MQERKSIDGRATGLMIILCAIWSLQQITLKASAPDMAPTLQIAIRSGLSMLMVGALLVSRKEPILVGNAWKPGILAGVLFAVEYLLAGEGLRFTSASHMVVFLYTAPGFTALGLHFFIPEERLRPVQWAGMGLAFVGIILAFYDSSPGGEGFSGSMLFGDLLGLLAGLCWGATTVVIRCTSLSEIPAKHTLLYQLAGAFVILTVASVVGGHMDFRLTPEVWGSLFFQTVIVSFASFLAWYWLLRFYLASILSVLSFLTPVFGIIFGVLLLNDFWPGRRWLSSA